MLPVVEARNGANAPLLVDAAAWHCCCRPQRQLNLEQQWRWAAAGVQPCGPRRHV
jgi:hypothetical protein